MCPFYNEMDAILGTHAASAPAVLLGRATDGTAPLLSQQQRIYCQTVPNLICCAQTQRPVRHTEVPLLLLLPPLLLLLVQLVVQLVVQLLVLLNSHPPHGT